MTALYHYTCAHAAPHIRRERLLRPLGNWKLYDAALERAGCPTSGLSGRPPIVWLTTLCAPNVEALGLTGTITACDRTEFRVTLPRVGVVEPWADYKARVSPSKAWIDSLEAFGQPDAWLVSEASMPISTIERMVPV